MALPDGLCFLHGISLNRGAVPSFEVFPFAIPAIRTLQSLKFHPRVTFFVGENGAGKSTLLEAIALAEGFNEKIAVEPRRRQTTGP